MTLQQPISSPSTTSQRGEISTILTAITVVVLTVSLAIAATRVQMSDVLSRLTKAQQNTMQRIAGSDAEYTPLQGSCTYQSFIFVFKEEENSFFAPQEIGLMKVTNDRGGSLQLDHLERSQNHFAIGEFPFDPQRTANYARGDIARLKLEGFDRSSWRVKSFSCFNRGVRGCPEEAEITELNRKIAAQELDGTTIENFKVDCGVDVTYSWVLENKPSLPDDTQPTQKPTETPPPACPYTSVAQVNYQTRGADLSLSQLKELGGSKLEVQNDRSQKLILEQNGLSKNSFSIDPMPFDETGKNYYKKGSQASVELVAGSFPSSLRVKEVYCEDKGPTKGCPSAEQISALNSSISQGAGTGFKLDGFKVDCGVDVSYGWIVEPSPAAGGSMEVRVEALNYPQKTDIWDSDHISSYKPGSCSRQEKGEQRPLYLGSYKVTATCVSGECEGVKPITLKTDRRIGYTLFQDIKPGRYTLAVDGLDDRGYEMWEQCGKKEWLVEKGKTTQEPVIFLANLKDGEYERMPTDQACKDAGGFPNLVEGLDGGNVCYYKDGKKKDDDDEKGGTGGGGDTGGNFEEECKKLENGKEGVCVMIENRDSNLDRIDKVFSNPPSALQIKESVVFGGQKKFITFRMEGSLSYPAQILLTYPMQMLNGASQSETDVECHDGTSQPNTGVGIGPNNEFCSVKPSKTARVKYVMVPAGSKPDKPVEPKPDPGGGGKVGKCQYITSQQNNCNLANIHRHFGDLGDDIVKKMSAICYRESAQGDPKALNKGCLKVEYTKEYSVGLLQINTIDQVQDTKGNRYGPCVDKLPYGPTGPVCRLREDTQACFDSVAEINTNLSIGRWKYDNQGLNAWGWTARHCGFIN